ncbi:MAG TPA: DHH family phosphoesterase [Methanotrichaceae archaeon]|nr:DHH family phosphoesterase [Methanotrichaceae archaeon]
MRIDESQFGSHIRRYDDVLYLCHRNADPDAIGSAYSLQSAFGGSIGVAEDISKSAGSLIDAVRAEVIIDPDVENYGFVVVVDTSVRLQLGAAKLGKYAVVDHHLDHSLIQNAEFYIQRPANSTAEIAWRILSEEGIRPTREMALAMVVGIISDTGRFRRGMPEAFRAVSDILLAGGLNYDEALMVLSSTPSDVSQRIATLKAAARSEIEWTGDWIVATTEINSFEGTSAMSLVDIGADVAFAAGKHGNLTRVSGRARREAGRAGIDLSEIMRSVAKSHYGEGGGHRGAAALEAPADARVLLADLRKKVLEKFRDRP